MLNREIKNEKIFFGETGEKPEIKIEQLLWYIPQISPSLEIENLINKRLLKNKPIPINFLKLSVTSV